MKIIKKYKWFILGFFILLAIIAVWLGKDLLLNIDGALYGHRLEGIEDVPITNETKKEISDFLSSTEGVEKVKIYVHGKILNIIIWVDDTMTVDKVKEISNAALEKCSEEQKSFYDISFLVDYAKETEDKKFPMIGNKNKNSKQIVW